MPKEYSQASLIAPIARAANAGVDRKILDQFREVFISGGDVCNEEALQAAYKLKALIDKGENGGIHTSNGQSSVEFYKVATQALKLFLDGNSMGKKHGASDEYWPLEPDEPSSEA